MTYSMDPYKFVQWISVCLIIKHGLRIRRRDLRSVHQPLSVSGVDYDTIKIRGSGCAGTELQIAGARGSFSICRSLAPLEGLIAENLY